MISQSTDTTSQDIHQEFQEITNIVFQCLIPPQHQFPLFIYYQIQHVYHLFPAMTFSYFPSLAAIK
jgi:hypothetical protein